MVQFYGIDAVSIFAFSGTDYKERLLLSWLVENFLVKLITLLKLISQAAILLSVFHILETYKTESPSVNLKAVKQADFKFRA